MYRDEVVGLEACMTHEEIIVCLDNSVKNFLHEDRANNFGNLSAKGETLQNAFMFFITSISKKIKI